MVSNEENDDSQETLSETKYAGVGYRRYSYNVSACQELGVLSEFTKTL
jgi:hypothetical protein